MVHVATRPAGRALRQNHPEPSTKTTLPGGRCCADQNTAGRFGLQYPP